MFLSVVVVLILLGRMSLSLLRVAVKQSMKLKINFQCPSHQRKNLKERHLHRNFTLYIAYHKTLICSWKKLESLQYQSVIKTHNHKVRLNKRNLLIVETDMTCSTQELFHHLHFQLPNLGSFSLCSFTMTLSLGHVYRGIFLGDCFEWHSDLRWEVRVMCTY